VPPSTGGLAMRQQHLLFNEVLCEPSSIWDCSNPVLRSSESSVRTYVPAPENVGPAGLVSERPPGEVETRGESKEGIWFTRAEGTTRKNN